MKTPDSSQHKLNRDLNVARGFAQQAYKNLINLNIRRDAIQRRHAGIELKIEVLLEEIQKIKKEWRIV